MSVAPAPEGRVRLPVFEGPLDLLLYLIRKNEIDVHDIPIVEVTQQYTAMLDQLRQAGLLDLDFAGDYFLLAATLIQVKTRMLLPRAPLIDGEEPFEDPRADLVRQLLEYERYREAAMLLKEKADLASTMLTRPDESVKHLHGTEVALDADLVSLAKAFRKVLEDKRLRTPHVLSHSRYTVRDRISHVLALLERPREAGTIFLFSSLFDEGTIEEAVVTFLAILELVKRGFVRVAQPRLLQDIELVLVPSQERPDADALAPSEFDEPDAVDPGEDASNDFDRPADAGGEEE